MKTEENKQFIRRFVEETVNKKNLDAIDELVEQDFIERVPLTGQGPGRAGLKYAIGMLLTAFPDMKWTTDEQVAEGDKVVSRFTWTGTHQGEFLGIPPTQRKVTVWGVVIDVVRGGRFAESRLIMDTMGLMQQLGVVPNPESGA
jgi:predicted ester cyclase